MKIRNKFLAAAGLVAGITLGSVGVYATVAPLETPQDPPRTQSSYTTLEEYSQMDRDEQLALILGAKNDVIAQIRERNPERALCVAGLFDTDEEGNKQFADIKGILNAAAQRSLPQTAQDIAELIITNKFCPDRAIAMK